VNDYPFYTTQLLYVTPRILIQEGPYLIEGAVGQAAESISKLGLLGEEPVALGGQLDAQFQDPWSDLRWLGSIKHEDVREALRTIVVVIRAVPHVCHGQGPDIGKTSLRGTSDIW
jgi:hypothetical protein